MKKRFFAVFLTLSLAFSLVVPVSAAESDASSAANALHDLGLFQGVGNNADGTPNFDLDRVPTRAEGVTMLVRLMGKDAEATSKEWTTPFTDVVPWARPYVGCAYVNGFTKGTSDTTFSGEASINAAQFLTLVLRAMGYKDGEDFLWTSPWTLTDELGITDGTVGPESKFNRADIAKTCFKAMTAKCKDGKTLIEHLIDAGVCTPEQADKAGIKVPGYDPKPDPTPTPTPKPSKQTEIIYNGDPTGIDPQHPNGDVPATPIEEMPELIKNGKEYQPGESSEGLLQPGKVIDYGSFNRTIEYEKYIELPNGTVGVLVSKYNRDEEYTNGYFRSIDLTVTMYVGETMDIDLSCFGDLIPYDKWFAYDTSSIAVGKNNGDGTATISALSPGHTYVIDGRTTGELTEVYSCYVDVYGKRPSSFDKVGFKVDTDYDRTIYSTGNNLEGVLPNWNSWSMPKGSTGFDATKAERDAVVSILITPSANDNVPKHDLDSDGHVKVDVAYNYYKFENMNGNRSVLSVGHAGTVIAGEILTSSAENEVNTVKITSLATGQSVYIDFALNYAEF